MIWLYVWLGIMVVTLVVEFLTQELVSIWISAGAFISMILAGCSVSLEIQIIVALAVSLACLIGLRKITLKVLNRNKEKTNIDIVVGKKLKLLTPITKDSSGSVKYNGIVYTAITENNEELEESNYVIVKKVEGNKFIVEKEN